MDSGLENILTISKKAAKVKTPTVPVSPIPPGTQVVFMIRKRECSRGGLL
jgi:hypothetical protein